MTDDPRAAQTPREVISSLEASLVLLRTIQAHVDALAGIGDLSAAEIAQGTRLVQEFIERAVADLDRAREMLGPGESLVVGRGIGKAEFLERYLIAEGPGDRQPVARFEKGFRAGPEDEIRWERTSYPSTKLVAAAGVWLVR